MISFLPQGSLPKSPFHSELTTGKLINEISTFMIQSPSPKSTCEQMTLLGDFDSDHKKNYLYFSFIFVGYLCWLQCSWLIFSPFSTVKISSHSKPARFFAEKSTARKLRHPSLSFLSLARLRTLCLSLTFKGLICCLGVDLVKPNLNGDLWPEAPKYLYLSLHLKCFLFDELSVFSSSSFFYTLIIWIFDILILSKMSINFTDIFSLWTLWTFFLFLHLIIYFQIAFQ